MAVSCPYRDGKKNSGPKCFSCGKFGHYERECPDKVAPKSPQQGGGQGGPPPLSALPRVAGRFRRSVLVRRRAPSWVPAFLQ